MMKVCKENSVWTMKMMPRTKSEGNCFLSFVVILSLFVSFMTDAELTKGSDHSGCSYKVSTQILDCKNLVGIPMENIWRFSTHIYISSSNISVLQNDAFKTFRKVKELSIQESNVYSVEPYAFRGLEVLEFLHLPHNRIQTLSSVVLPENLQFLDVSNNPFDVSREHQFPKFSSSLLTLYSSNVGLKEITSSAVHGLKSLSRWRVMRNNLAVLNLGILTDLEKISYIDLEFNRIEKIVPLTGEKKLEHLTFLDIGYNSLTSLNENVFQGLPALQELRLHDNPLVIPENVPFLSQSSIIRITLSRINAAAISRSTFQNLPLLSSVELIDSKITDISSVFYGLQQLQYLNLKNNSVEIIKRGTFYPSGKFRQLIVSYNPLREFEKEAIEGVMTSGAVDISNTPVACSSQRFVLQDWCQKNSVDLHVTCASTNNSTCKYDYVTSSSSFVVLLLGIIYAVFKKDL